MPSITFGESTFDTQDDETVLDALLRNGHEIANGCRAGVCQSCLLIAKEVALPANATSGLSDSQKAIGAFKSCCVVPSTDIEVQSADGAIESHKATIVEKTSLNDAVIRVRLQSDVNYRAGQYVSLQNDAKLMRSYSIASVSGTDKYLEFHIRRYPNGQFSNWIYSAASIGSELILQGPSGTCFYTPTDAPSNLLMLASGTGLAPMHGIIRDALLQQHQGNIHLIIAAKTSDDFYYVDELKTLSDENSNFSFERVALQSTDADIKQADIYEHIRSDYTQLKGYRVYICGGENFVKKLKKQCFLAGANMQDIFSDSFLSFTPN